MEQELRFEIIGNQENPKGNPIPYVRSTQRGQHKPAVRRYNTWKRYVLNAFYRKHHGLSPTVGGAPLFTGKVLATSKKLPMTMNLKIFWSSDAHADPDNVFKGIADALFSDDKYLAGSFSFHDADDGIGRVEVQILYTV